MVYAHIFIRSATAPETIEMEAMAKPNCINQNNLLDMVRFNLRSSEGIPMSKAIHPFDAPYAIPKPMA